MVDVVVRYIEQWGTRIRRIVKECADKTPVNHKVIISQNQRLILKYLQSNEFITNKIARAQIGLKETATKNLLKHMWKKGLSPADFNQLVRQPLYYLQIWSK